MCVCVCVCVCVRERERERERERGVKERIGRDASSFVKSSEFQISGLEEGFHCQFHYDPTMKMVSRD